MLCPMCREPMGEMCEECGVFFEKQEYVITDFRNLQIRHRRVYKRLDHFKEILSQFQGKEGKEIPNEVVDRIREKHKEGPGNNQPTRRQTKPKTPEAHQVCGKPSLHPPRFVRTTPPLHKERNRRQAGSNV